MSDKYSHGQIIWRDLTVTDVDSVKSFYESVVGWQMSPHDKSETPDYDVLLKETKEIISGICRKTGINGDLPSVWLNYIYVDDVKSSIDSCIKKGGHVLIERKMGTSDFALLKDPSGAIFVIIH